MEIFLIIRQPIPIGVSCCIGGVIGIEPMEDLEPIGDAITIAILHRGAQSLYKLLNARCIEEGKERSDCLAHEPRQIGDASRIVRIAAGLYLNEITIAIMVAVLLWTEQIE